METRASKKKQLPPKICKNCATEFIPSRWWQEFCQTQGTGVCRTEFWNKTHKRTTSVLGDKLANLEDRVDKLEGKDD